MLNARQVWSSFGAMGLLLGLTLWLDVCSSALHQELMMSTWLGSKSEPGNGSNLQRHCHVYLQWMWLALSWWQSVWPPASLPSPRSCWLSAELCWGWCHCCENSLSPPRTIWMAHTPATSTTNHQSGGQTFLQPFDRCNQLAYISS